MVDPFAPLELFHNPLSFFEKLAQQQGPRARLEFGKQRFYLINDPELIQHFLVHDSAHFEKFPKVDKTRGLFGEGLLTSEEPFHLRQRRLAQPAFHRERMAGYAAEMVAATERICSGWQDGQVFDAAEAMNRLALDIVSRTLFSTQTDDRAARIGHALDDVLKTLNHLVMPWGNLMMSLPLPITRRYHAALDELDEIVYGFIRERRASGVDHGDLLSLLLNAQDAETGERMSDQQLRDEVMTIFVAGHDTSANALAWSLYLLSQHPEARQRLEEDDEALSYTSAVFHEALRLYPPVWILGRRALSDYHFQDFHAPKGSILLVCMAVLHRQAHLWEDAQSFRPERWRNEAKHHRYAYLPFGAGSRLCIGERFAWQEGALCLSTLAKKWRLDLVPGSPVEPLGLLTLRPKFGLPMTAKKRAT